MLDGNELKTLTTPDADGGYSIVTDTRKLSRGVPHRLKAKVFSNNSTKFTTLKRAFRRCKSKQRKFKFTG